jgi:release factor glutamine methyltransferase
VAQTILSVLARAKGLLKAHEKESWRLEAEILLAHVLGISRTDLIIHPERPLADHEIDEYQALLVRRIKREPIAYILGAKEFFGRSFQVNPHVLIPRPETEALVELSLSAAPQGGVVMEIGVGSGAVIVTLLCERGDLIGYGNDISIQAIKMAGTNARAHGVIDRLHLFVGDLFSSLKNTFPLIIANPPYVALPEAGSMEDDVVLYEPGSALFGGKDGLDIVKEIIGEVLPYLAPGGILIMEVGHGHKDAIDTLVGSRQELLLKKWENDLAGIPRVAIIERVHG